MMVHWLDAELELLPWKSQQENMKEFLTKLWIPLDTSLGKMTLYAASWKMSQCWEQVYTPK